MTLPGRQALITRVGIVAIASLFLVFLVILAFIVYGPRRTGKLIDTDLVPTNATVMFCPGNFQLMRANAWQAGGKGVALAEGDIVETGVVEHIIIALDQANNLRLGENTRCTLVELKKNQRLGCYSVKINLEKGRLWAVTNHRAGLMVETSNASLAIVQGCTRAVFEVQYPEADLTRLLVMEGDVSIRPADGSAQGLVAHSKQQVGYSSPGQFTLKRGVSPASLDEWQQWNIGARTSRNGEESRSVSATGPTRRASGTISTASPGTGRTAGKPGRDSKIATPGPKVCPRCGQVHEIASVGGASRNIPALNTPPPIPAGGKADVSPPATPPPATGAERVSPRNTPPPLGGGSGPGNPGFSPAPRTASGSVSGPLVQGASNAAPPGYNSTPFSSTSVRVPGYDVGSKSAGPTGGFGTGGG